ncbi:MULTISPECIES: HVO_A0556 family zinc finger protein [unclassified Natrinema]|uniref:HVO_A0556 family zinc finger protein n=1 Tax=unclassified Natrinema TaxID=2622230 RepID=UPI0009DCE691
MSQSGMQNVETTDDRHKLVDELIGRPCSFCDDGSLMSGSYKGNRAVICEGCETPAAQLW